MSSSFLLSTPSSSGYAIPSPKMEFQILDQVSRMTLDEPSVPASPRFSTPQVRKRRNSIIVTPPRAQLLESMEEDCQEDFSFGVVPSMTRGLPPMLPNSAEMDAGDQNPFERHRPIHSPFSGVSRLNTDFLSTIQAESNLAQGSEHNKVPGMAQRQAARPPQVSSSHFTAAFPSLEDEDDSCPCPSSLALITAGALKMRRRCREEYSIFESNL